jgi:RNA polymerase sigma-70 factor, ECF subfamily
LDDQILVARIRQGDMEAASILLSRYQNVAYTVALRLMGNAFDAEDVAQDVLLRAYTRIADLQEGASFPGWIRRIAVNSSLNALRRRGRLQVEPLEPRDGGHEAGPVLQLESADATPEDEALSRALEMTIAAALARLPAEQRVAVVLRDMYGYNVAEVAAAQQCGLSAAKMRIVRGRLLLRRLLTEAHISQDSDGD